MANPTFNLITQPWIPIVERGGTTRKVSLAELFARAHELVEVADPSPLTTFAFHRMLLAITHRVANGPRNTAEWKKLWEKGRFEQKEFEAYFQKWHDRFDLFHEQWPFLQIGDFVTVKGDDPVTTPVTRLLVEVASGNNATLFDHTVEVPPKALRADHAARALITAQAWGLGGGQGPTSRNFGKHPYMSHAPCVGAVATLVQRETVFETLCANLARIGEDQPVPFRSPSDDTPTWERNEPRPPVDAVPTGYLEYLTWLARHVRLIPDVAAAGTVSEMCFAPGASIDSDAGYQNPFASYRVSDAHGKKAIGLDPARAVWRDSAALFALPADKPSAMAPAAVTFCRAGRTRLLAANSLLNIACYGLATERGKAAKAVAWRVEAISTSVKVVEDPEAVVELERALLDVEAASLALSGAVRQLAYTSLETETKTPDVKEVSRIQTRLLARTSFWERIEGGFHRFVRLLTPEARSEWLKEARRAAQDALFQASKFTQGSVARRDRALALATQKLSRELPGRGEARTVERANISTE